MQNRALSAASQSTTQESSESFIPEFVIRQISHNLFDVFTGEGWENWTRFKRVNGRLNLVGGTAVSKELYNTLIKGI